MKKLAVAFALLIVIVVVAGVVFIGGPRGPALSEVEPLKQPRLADEPSRRVLVVTATGDPDRVGKSAFGLLMKTYFGLQGVPKGSGMPAPRARWPIAVDTPKEQWVGHYAMPLPDDISEPSGLSGEGNMTVEFSRREYGQVAEILHVGRYDQETQTIARLQAFIADAGYEISGDHEEEYLRGPGLWFAGNPESYLTLIRYQVRKTTAELHE